jgi:hypothetical protein
MSMESRGVITSISTGENWFVHQSSLATLSAESFSSKLGDTWLRKWWIWPSKYLSSYFKAIFTCRKIILHGAEGFTSPPKEVVLPIFISLKNRVGRVWIHEPWVQWKACKPLHHEATVRRHALQNTKQLQILRFYVFTAMEILIVVSWVMMPCNLVVYKTFHNTVPPLSSELNLGKHLQVHITSPSRRPQSTFHHNHSFRSRIYV